MVCLLHLGRCKYMWGAQVLYTKFTAVIFVLVHIIELSYSGFQVPWFSG